MGAVTQFTVYREDMDDFIYIDENMNDIIQKAIVLELYIGLTAVIDDIIVGASPLQWLALRSLNSIDLFKSLIVEIGGIITVPIIAMRT